MGATYAPSLPISVKTNSKLLVMPAAPSRSVGTFQTMWNNHPMSPTNGAVHYPCNNGGPPLRNMQCFVRLCEALHLSGVSFKEFRGSSCKLNGADHAHHFRTLTIFQPGSRQAGRLMSGRQSPHFRPNQCLVLPPSDLLKVRQGIILFTHYFSIKGQTSMWGGHIDLWNKDRMGNTYTDINPMQGESAFLRSKTISFWPLVGGMWS